MPQSERHEAVLKNGPVTRADVTAGTRPCDSRSQKRIQCQLCGLLNFQRDIDKSSASRSTAVKLDDTFTASRCVLQARIAGSAAARLRSYRTRARVMLTDHW